MTTTKPSEELEVFNITDGLISWSYGTRKLIDKHFYTNALKRISKLEAENAKMREALKAVQKHGLGHYEDCPNAAYDDEACDCGMETTELLILHALKECEGGK